ncbi:MAG: tetratricopeptide repeat protein [Bacteroidota bacterium]|nr:tetratricopeptide repeat protein [Bacteroidota bacterium]
MVRLTSLRIFVVISLLSIGYIGCGGSEETMAEDEMVTDTGIAEETPQDQPQETTEEPAQEPAVQEQPIQEQPVIQEGPTKEQLQADLDAIKSENMQLKDENSSLQQTNKDFSTKISDLEAANAALANSSKKAEPVKVQKRQAIAGKSSSDEIRAYESAISIAKSRNYRDAIGELQTLLNSGIKDDYADNCHYWMGECNFQLKDYSQAIQHFQLVQGYRFSEKRDDAQIMIAQSYERLGDKQKSKTEYQKLLDMYPTSEYAKRARAKVK